MSKNQLSLDEVAPASDLSDARSLTKLGNTKFVIANAVRSDYTQGGQTQDGVLITTTKPIEVKDDSDNTEQISQFYTTRTAIVKRLLSEQVQTALQDGHTIGPVRCVKKSGKNGFSYFMLEAA